MACLWFSVCLGSAIARPRVRCLRRSPARRGHRRNPFLRFLLLGLIRLLLRRLHRHLLLFRLPRRLPIRLRIPPLLSRSRILRPSVIFRLGPRIRRIAVRTAIQRPSRPLVQSTLLAPVIPRAAGHLTDGGAGLRRALGIVRARRVQGWPPRWRPRMKWGADSPAC